MLTVRGRPISPRAVRRYCAQPRKGPTIREGRPRRGRGFGHNYEGLTVPLTLPEGNEGGRIPRASGNFALSRERACCTRRVCDRGRSVQPLSSLSCILFNYAFAAQATTTWPSWFTTTTASSEFKGLDISDQRSKIKIHFQQHASGPSALPIAEVAERRPEGAVFIKYRNLSI